MLYDLPVVGLDDASHISHTTVGQLDCLSVEYAVVWVVLSEVMVDKLKKFLAHVGFH